MLSRERVIRLLQQQQGYLAEEYGVKWLGLFGSFARNEADENSDVDLLVRFSRDNDLLTVIELERELSEQLERHVDLLTEPAISPHLKDYILNDLRIIYET